MQFEPHQRARWLLDQAMVEGISAEDQRWLDAHAGECAGCARYAELSRRAVRALDSFAFELNPAAALQMENAIRSRAAELAAAESGGRKIWTAIVAVLFLTIAGSVAMWQPAAWLAGRWNLPAPVWQIGFAMYWLLPSILAGVLPLFRKKLMGDDAREGQTI